MKYSIKLFIFSSLLSVIFVSCKDEAQAPVISNFEVGLQNSKTAYLGADLHLEAKIVADAKIAKIVVTIHPESETEAVTVQKSVSKSQHSAEWEVDTTYTGVYAGVKNTTFHEHIDVPVNATTGIYHLHFKVIDLDGNTSETEYEISLVAPVADGSLPLITISNAPAENQLFTTNQTIVISGSITDVLGLSGVYIGLVKADAGLTDTQVKSSNTITMLHFHDFEDAKNYSFAVSLKVGATFDNDLTPKAVNWLSGDYYLVVKAPAIDGEVGFSAHYPVKIQL